VAGLKVSTWSRWHPAGVRDVVSSPRRWHRARPRRDNRQEADNGRSRRRDLQVALLPALPTADDHHIAVNQPGESSGVSVLHLPSGLLQLSHLWHYWSSTPAHSFCPECRGTTCVGNSSPRSHHTGPATAALAACRVQADTVGVQLDPRSAATVPR